MRFRIRLSKHDAKRPCARKWKRRNRTRTAPIVVQSRKAKATGRESDGRVAAGLARKQLRRVSRVAETPSRLKQSRLVNQPVMRVTRELTRSPQRVNFNLPAGRNPPPAAKAGGVFVRPIDR